MFETELFSDKRNVFYYIQEGTNLDKRLLESSDTFIITEDHKQADFLYNIRDKKIRFRSHEGFINLDFDDLSNLCELNRYFVRTFLEGEVFADYENEEDEEIYWRFFKISSEIYNSYESDFKILNHIFKSFEFKKYIDSNIVELDSIKFTPYGEDDVICHRNEYALLHYSREDPKTAKIAIKALRDFLDHIQELDLEESASSDEIETNQILNLINFPVVVLDWKELVINHNDLFTALKILPSVLSEKAREGWILHDGSKYKIMKQKMTSSFHLYILIEQEQSSESVTSTESELGIISGSIAHELNNPVGGILAASSLIELESWDTDNKKVIDEMKESARRCKSLIETFLGFSKYETHNYTNIEFKKIQEQALSLMRSRMVESGYSLNIEMSSELESTKAGSSVLTMVLYLLFSELITIFSHKDLINRELGNQLTLQFKLSGNDLIIEISNMELTKEDNTNLCNKLVLYLLQMQQIGFNIKGNQIVLDGFSRS